MVLCGFDKIISDLRSDFSNIDGGFIVWKISTLCVKIFPNPLTHENRKTLLNTSMLDLIAWNEYFSIGRLSLKFYLSQTLFFIFWHRWYRCEEKDAFHKETEHIAIPSDQFVEHLSSKSKMMLKYLRSLIFQLFFIRKNS